MKARMWECVALLLASALVVGCSGSESANGTPAPGDGTTDPGRDDELTPMDYPLLAEHRGGNRWANFCEGRSDDAVLPEDPRTLVVPGVNEGRAVAFNTYWKSCDNAVPKPTTCGEFREQYEIGEFVAFGSGEPGSPTSFAGGQESAAGVPAEDYNKLWETWGLSSRPENFDALVAERYGSPEAPWPNPYPLPGEDPNATDGGSGQLPLAFTQIREPDGTWTGKVGIKICVFCHNGQVDSASGDIGPLLGGGGSIGDFTMASTEMAQASSGFTLESALRLLTISTNRGSGAIDFFQLAFVLFSGGQLDLLLNPKILFSQAIGNIKSPPWWNMGYRTQKFHGAILPMDSSRITMAAYYNLAKSLTGSDDEALAWTDAHAGPFNVWASAQEPPRYPGEIDTELARSGAILFHAKDLWAEGNNNPAPEPAEGNGSCAGCHGAYSPRYINDPSYLEDPDLGGIAAYVTPMEIIRTDPVYAEAMQSLRSRDGGFPAATDNQNFLYCGHGAYGDTEDHTPVLLAPPLWGVWASAPYLHNASVPNLWGVLDPNGTERPNIWRRASTPVPDHLPDDFIMGFDTNFERAYDTEKMGWDYERLSCGDTGTQPVYACSPLNEDRPSTAQYALGLLYEQIGLTWNLPRIAGLRMNDQDKQNRKIYNTNLYSQGNQGHDFTAVLTDQERRAIIEYLKTL